MTKVKRRGGPNRWVHVGIESRMGAAVPKQDIFTNSGTEHITSGVHQGGESGFQPKIGIE